MHRHDDPELLPAERRDGAPTFDAPWQARIMGLLSELTRETRDDAFTHLSLRADSPGTALARETTPSGPEETQTQADCEDVLRLLESLLVDRGIVSAADIAARVERWTAAYENTPHGQPVLLSAADEASTR